MTDDIVVQLREEGFITHMAKLPRESKILHAAADEIEWLRNALETTQSAYADASLHRDRMRSQRDEARRTICYEYYLARDCRIAPELIAEEMGWDCFGERWKMMQDALDRVAQLGEEIENGET